jgi:hypothetical protein
MPRRRTTTHRDDLVTRWARITGTTFPAAWDATDHIATDILRDSVLAAEDMVNDVEQAEGVEPGEFADWIATKRRELEGQTTTIHGHTR